MTNLFHFKNAYEKKTIKFLKLNIDLRKKDEIQIKNKLKKTNILKVYTRFLNFNLKKIYSNYTVFSNFISMLKRIQLLILLKCEELYFCRLGL